MTATARLLPLALAALTACAANTDPSSISEPPNNGSAGSTDGDAAVGTGTGGGGSTSDAGVGSWGSGDAGGKADAQGPQSDAGTKPPPSDGGANTDGAAAGGDGGLSGLHVVRGSGGAPGHIVDGAGNPVAIHGADRSGTEFACLGGNFSDGPVDQTGLDAMKAWHINAVRVPMNEDCWLGINGVPAAFSGANYQKALSDWVNLITQNGMIAVIDLHWTAAGGSQSNAQQPMADADHAPTFWSQVAKAFAGNGSVIFDLFNEPFITDWGCWVKGGSCAQANGASYQVAGMAALLKAVRGAGADNVVILGGLAYSSDMTQWVTSVNSIPSLAAPLDGISLDNVAASWHSYDFNGQSGCPSQYNGYKASDTCDSADATATNTGAKSVMAAGFPVLIGELGISAFSAQSAASFSSTQVTQITGWLDGLMTYMESQGQGYVAWSWNTDTNPVLVTDYQGTPTVDFGATYKAHLKNF